LFVALGVGLACDDAPSPPPGPSFQGPARGDIIALLPHSAVAAVELRGVADRWDELREMHRFARLQDRMLAELGLDADDVPEIAGSHAVFALVFDEGSRAIVPVAVLDPPSRAEALARLGRSGKLVAVEGRGAVWAGPTSRARFVERIAVGDGTSLRDAVDIAALAEWLPPGGLVRAVIHPRALREYLSVFAEVEGSGPAGTMAALLRADLEAIEIAGFRRDIVAGEIVTDMWIGIDTDVVPEAVTTALTTPRGPAVLPSDLPTDLLLAKSFRVEADAGLAWLRAAAADDPRGPLRNLDFWIAEFEARSGRNVERDLAAALGERGIALVFEGEGDGAVEFVMILEADDPERLEAAVVDLRDWLAEQIWGRSLGLAIPRSWTAGEGTGTVHGLDFRSPFATVSAPVFQLANDQLIVATDQSSLQRGVGLAGSREAWTTPAWALVDGAPPDELALIRTAAVARLLAACAESHSGDGPWFLGPIREFLEGAGDGQVVVRYEERGFSVSARIRVDA
jgi:hypothetical protein